MSRDKRRVGSPGTLARLQAKWPGPQQTLPPKGLVLLILPAVLIPRMASGRARCTRKLRNWVVEQVDSGQFSGVCWEDEAKTMFRIPWKHAGKQDFREDQDAAFFKVKGPGNWPLSKRGMESTRVIKGLYLPGFQVKGRLERRTNDIISRAKCNMEMQKSFRISRWQPLSVNPAQALLCKCSRCVFIKLTLVEGQLGSLTCCLSFPVS